MVPNFWRLFKRSNLIWARVSNKGLMRSVACAEQARGKGKS